MGVRDPIGVLLGILGIIPAEQTHQPEEDGGQSHTPGDDALQHLVHFRAFGPARQFL